MARVALGLGYSGRAYHGWQVQPGLASVQQRVEQALAEFATQPVGTVCAGRTDTGVHAQQQVVHLDSPVERAEFSWVRGVNRFLPPDIRVQWARAVPDGFHARNSAVRRRYRYVLFEGPVAPATAHGQVGWVFTPLATPLQIDVMREAAALLRGQHDFSAFRAAECQALSPVKHLHRLDIVQRGPWWLFTFEADAFLHHMVRNLMGSLLAVGLGRRSVPALAALLASRDRTRGDPTFMPDGLYLDGVAYPAHYGLDALSWQPRDTLWWAVDSDTP